MTFTAVRKDVCPNLACQSYDQMPTKGCAPETPPPPLVAAASSSLSEPWLQTCCTCGSSSLAWESHVCALWPLLSCPQNFRPPHSQAPTVFYMVTKARTPPTSIYNCLEIFYWTPHLGPALGSARGMLPRLTHTGFSHRDVRANHRAAR